MDALKEQTTFEQSWAALRKLAELDPEGWEAWWEANIPENSTFYKMAKLTEARIEQLRKEGKP